MKLFATGRTSYLPILLIGMFIINGCSLFQPERIGKKAGSKSLDKLIVEADQFLVETDTLKLLSTKITQGALDRLLAPETRASLDSLLRVLGASADATVDSIATDLLIQVLNDSTRSTARLFLSELIDELNDGVRTARDDLLGDDTRVHLNRLLSELLSDSTGARLRVLRDSVFTPEFQGYFVNLVSSAAESGGEIVATKLERALTSAENTADKILDSFADKAIVVGIILLGGIAAIVLFLSRRRYQRLGKLITKEIHGMLNQDCYDELVRRIQSKAQENELEPFLRSMLEKQGLLGQAAWKGASSTKNSTSSGASP